MVVVPDIIFPFVSEGGIVPGNVYVIVIAAEPYYVPGVIFRPAVRRRNAAHGKALYPHAVQQVLKRLCVSVADGSPVHQRTVKIVRVRGVISRVVGIM